MYNQDWLNLARTKALAMYNVDLEQNGSVPLGIYKIRMPRILGNQTTFVYVQAHVYHSETVKGEFVLKCDLHIAQDIITI